MVKKKFFPPTQGKVQSQDLPIDSFVAKYWKSHLCAHTFNKRMH